VALKLGYLLPTREQIMDGRPEAAPLLSLAERAERLGYDSIWVGDSLLARPRHEPLTLLAGVAGRTRRVQLGTAVLLPALRNPVILAHVVATLDQVLVSASTCRAYMRNSRPPVCPSSGASVGCLRAYAYAELYGLDRASIGRGAGRWKAAFSRLRRIAPVVRRSG
jgi:hypothetical protein